MTKLRISYAITGVAFKQNIVVQLSPSEPTTRAIARAIIKHQFPELDSPFGSGETLTSKQALTRLAITDVRAWVVIDDDEGDDSEVD